MRILMLHSSSDLYGASRVLLTTTMHFIQAGHQVIVCLSERGVLAGELEKIGAQVVIIRLGILRRKYMNLIGMINRLYFIVKATWELTKIIRDQKIDLVYNNASSIFSGGLAAKFARRPHLWHIHEIIVHPAFFAKAVAFCMYYLSDLNVVVSEATRSHWITIYPKLEPKTKVIYNGIDTAFWRSKSKIPATNSDTIRVGMIARVHFWKGQSYFLQIASELTNKYDSVRFVMAGDAFPGYEYLYEELAEKKQLLGLNDRVTDLGYLPDPSDFYAQIDIFVLPSILPDPLPTTVLEAMASGKPVVATRHGGAVEMVKDGETGFLIPWDKPSVAAEVIGCLVESADLRTKMGEAGRQRVQEKFSIEANEQAMLRVLDELDIRR